MGSVNRKSKKKRTIILLKIIPFSEKIDNNILGPNFFDLKLTRPKHFKTERTRRLTCLSSFCELVLSGVLKPLQCIGWAGGSTARFMTKS